MEETGFYVDLGGGRMFAHVELDGGELWLTAHGGQRIVRLIETHEQEGVRHYVTADPYLGFFWFGRGAGEGRFLRMQRGRKESA